MILLELMTTEGCHLCEQVEPMLVATVDPAHFEVDLVDIAFDDNLMERYATRIPVLRVATTGEELGWPFDLEQLSEFLAGALNA